MGSLNQVSLIGHVGMKPVLKKTEDGAALARFSVATNDEWREAVGTARERTEWHRVVAWGRLAEVIGEHLLGGRQVHVQGPLRTREWTDTEGAKRSVTEVHATRVLFLGSKPQASGLSPADTLETEPVSVSDDDIPF